MTRGAAYVGALVLAVLGLLGVPVTAEAVPAAQPHVTVHLDRSTVTSGTPITVRAHANLPCDWIVQFHGERRHSTGTSARTSFIAPDVSTRTRLKVAVTCFARPTSTQPRKASSSASASGGRAAEIILVRVPAKATVETPVVVIPSGGTVEPPHTGGGGAGLPNTGGPHRLLLGLGLGAVLIGLTLVRIGRRQRPAIASAMPRVAS